MKKASPPSSPKKSPLAIPKSASSELFSEAPKIERAASFLTHEMTPLLLEEKAYNAASVSLPRPLILSGGSYASLPLDVSSTSGRFRRRSSVDTNILSLADSASLHSSPRQSFSGEDTSPNGSAPYFVFPPYDANEINAWVVPYVYEGTALQSLKAYQTKLTQDYLDRIVAVSKKLRVRIAVRVQNDPLLPSNRRYSLMVPDTKTIIATAKRPPLRSKTNSARYLCHGRIARRPQLQEKATNVLDNSVPGSWPTAIKEHPVDSDKTTLMQHQVSADILEVKQWFNLICWKELVPEYCQIGDEIYPKDTMKEKYYIQEAVHLYWLLQKIKRDENSPTNEMYGFKFIAASSQYLLFTFNGEMFKIKFDTLMPPIDLQIEGLQSFTNLDGFRKFLDDNDIEGHHGALFYRNQLGDFVPEMVWCGENGHITGDADAQYFGKRFDMPRIAYATFKGDLDSDHPKFVNGLELFKARLLCKTATEFREYVAKCGFDVSPYITMVELHDYEHYINYMDPNNGERYEYYHDIFLPMLEETIQYYAANYADLGVVCHSDLYNLIVQLAIKHPLSIHAEEVTNLHAGEVGALLTADEELLQVSENELSSLISIFSDPTLLRDQVIGVNPYYLRDREDSNELSLQWLDTIIIRCLNAAAISDFEFKMHWITITTGFAKDKQFGPCAISKVNAALQPIQNALASINDPDERSEFIREKLASVYENYAALIERYNHVVAQPLHSAHGSLSAKSVTTDQSPPGLISYRSSSEFHKATLS